MHIQKLKNVGGNKKAPTPTLGSLQTIYKTVHMCPRMPNSHYSQPPTPCDWGPAQGQGLGWRVVGHMGWVGWA